MPVEKEPGWPQVDRRMTSMELAMMMIVNVVKLQTEKIDAVLKAVTGDDGPSETSVLLKEVAAAMEAMVGTLEDLPDRIGVVIREELSGQGDMDLEDASATSFDKDHTQ